MLLCGMPEDNYTDIRNVVNGQQKFGYLLVKGNFALGFGGKDNE